VQAGQNIFAVSGSASGDASAGPLDVTGSTGADVAFNSPGNRPGSGSPLMPSNAFGLAFWLSVAGAVALVVIYRALPD
jgi:hypothetical protein